MPILTPAEKEFLDVFLHEATTSPFFRGPASKAFFGMGAQYPDISFLSWAYHHEVGMTDYGWGHAADVAPPLPWPDRAAVLARNRDVQRIWQQHENGAKQKAV